MAIIAGPIHTSGWIAALQSLQSKMNTVAAKLVWAGKSNYACTFKMLNGDPVVQPSWQATRTDGGAVVSIPYIINKMRIAAGVPAYNFSEFSSVVSLDTPQLTQCERAMGVVPSIYDYHSYQKEYREQYITTVGFWEWLIDNSPYEPWKSAINHLNETVTEYDRVLNGKTTVEWDVRDVIGYSNDWFPSDPTAGREHSLYRYYIHRFFFCVLHSSLDYDTYAVVFFQKLGESSYDAWNSPSVGWDKILKAIVANAQNGISEAWAHNIVYDEDFDTGEDGLGSNGVGDEFELAGPITIDKTYIDSGASGDCEEVWTSSGASINTYTTSASPSKIIERTDYPGSPGATDVIGFMFDILDHSLPSFSEDSTLPWGNLAAAMSGLEPFPPNHWGTASRHRTSDLTQYIETDSLFFWRPGK